MVTGDSSIFEHSQRGLATAFKGYSYSAVRFEIVPPHLLCGLQNVEKTVRLQITGILHQDEGMALGEKRQRHCEQVTYLKLKCIFGCRL
jgi:hypothetical protein